MHWASTFNQLHEAAVIKEMASPPSASAASPGPDIIKSVAEKAKKELSRLQVLPPSSHKWTWGEQLTESDILSLSQTVEGQQQVSHSGYQLSLRLGQPAGQDSPYPSMPKSLKDSNPNNLLPHSSTPPDYLFPSLSYFESHDNLVYNPLGKLHKEYITRADNDHTLSMAGLAPHLANSANAYHLAKE